MKLSVIIPVYNVSRYLRECLDSVATQTYPDWECICVDDGSTDGSGAILDEYAAKDPRFKVVHQKNEGAASARNEGLRRTVGDYILFLDGDDLIPLGYLAAHLSARQGLPSDVITYAGYSLLDADGVISPYEIHGMRNYDSIADFMAAMLSGLWSPIISSWVWPKSILSQGIAWAADIVSQDDFEFSFRQLSRCRHAARYISGVNAIYRQHANGLSHLKHDEDYFASIFKVAERRGEYALAVEDSARMRGAIAQWWYSLLFSMEILTDRRRSDFVLGHLEQLGMPRCSMLKGCPRQNAFMQMFGLRTLLLLLRAREWIRSAIR